jgi:hypothetical protein
MDMCMGPCATILDYTRRETEFKPRTINQHEPCGAAVTANHIFPAHEIMRLCVWRRHFHDLTERQSAPPFPPTLRPTELRMQTQRSTIAGQRTWALCCPRRLRNADRRKNGRTTMKPNVWRRDQFIKRPVTDLIRRRSDSPRFDRLTASIRRRPVLRCSRRCGLRAEIAAAAAASRCSATASETGPCRAPARRRCR